MMKNWQKVFSSEQVHKAELVKMVLQDFKLQPVVLKKRDSVYNSFGYYEVLVAPDQVIKAIKIIEDDISL